MLFFLFGGVGSTHLTCIYIYIAHDAGCDSLDLLSTCILVLRWSLESHHSHHEVGIEAAAAGVMIGEIPKEVWN